MSFSEFTIKDYEQITREYAGLEVAARRRCANEEEFATVRKAFEFANEAHKNVRRRSGEPFILHPVAVAKIVVNDIGLGCKSISAALLHDVVEDTDYTVDDIRRLFGEKIALLVEGLTKIKSVLDNENKDYHISPESLQAENFKRILLTLNDDVRVVLIKLADRLHNCRTIEYMPEHKRDKILSETMFVFIPLAHRLGLYEIKTEMENIWLRYKEPDAYNEISLRVSQNARNHSKEIDQFIRPIDEALRNAGFDFHIKKRVKSPYSIWHKMQTKHVTFDQVYDLYAVRVIFNPSEANKESERDQCYHIFSIITGIYKYQPDRVRDWVKSPKSNGYEALHCTLMSHMGVWVEVQIRTKRMDDIAEKGIAAHWAYKNEGYIGESTNEADRWLEQVKEILTNKDDINAFELLDIIHEDLTQTEILVFTPKGEQRSIRNGSTVLDFAYRIHTDIGNKAIAGKVNMKLVPLSHILKTGDQVEIITAENGKPKKEWLQFLHTRHAVNLVMEYFKSDQDALVAEGAGIFRDIVASAGLKVTNSTIKKVLNGCHLIYVEDLYFRVALGVINREAIARALSGNIDEEYEKYELGGRDDEGHRYVIASCCCPIPGDPVIGFKREDGAIVLHKKTCKIAEGLASKYGDKLEVAKWSKFAENRSFPARITIKGLDRVGLLSDITHYISMVMGVNMKKLVLGADAGIFEGDIELFVKDRDILDEMIRQLSSIDGIQDVIRTDI